MTQTSAPRRVLNFGALSLKICFGFRASGFGLRPRRSCKKLRCAPLSSPAPQDGFFPMGPRQFSRAEPSARY